MALPVVVGGSCNERRAARVSTRLEEWDVASEGSNERTARVLGEWSGMQVCCAVGWDGEQCMLSQQYSAK